MSVVIIPLFAFTLCALLHIAALRIFPHCGLLDFPERYGLHRPRLPYPTGILPILTFLLLFSAFSPWNTQNQGLVIGILLLGGTAFLDDRTPLPSSLRLAVQILVAFIIFATGSRIYTITNPLEYITGIPYLKLDSLVVPSPFFILNSQFSILASPFPLLAGLFTILWLGLAMNALNWFDGIPGQVSSLSAVGFIIIGLLALSSRVNQPHLALLAFILAGIAAACLLFDFPFTLSLSKGHRVLMGDTGAMFFGLMLGILTIYAGGKVATAFLAFGVPFTDCLIVIVRRILTGRSPLRGSLTGEHLHHRLLARGWLPRNIIGMNILLGTGFGVAALFLSTTGKFIVALVLMGIMIVLHASTSTIAK